MPWIVGFGFAAFIATMFALNLRFFRNLWHSIRSGDKDLDDPWDPFG